MNQKYPKPKRSVKYTIHINDTDGRYEFWNGRLLEVASLTRHPAFKLAYKTAQAFPHLAAIAWRGARVIADGRLTLTSQHSAAITNDRGNDYHINRYQTDDYDNMRYEPDTQSYVPRLKTVTTCTCPSYQRNQYRWQGGAICKHIWAFRAQLRLNWEAAHQERPTQADPYAYVHPGVRKLLKRQWHPDSTNDHHIATTNASPSERERHYHGRYFRGYEGASRYVMRVISQGGDLSTLPKHIAQWFDPQTLQQLQAVSHG